MEYTEDQLIENYEKQSGPCHWMILPYKNEFTCNGCGCNVIKRKLELSKSQPKKLNFINRLKDAEHKKLCICVDIDKIYEGDDYEKIYEVLSTLKNIHFKINNILLEKYNDMLGNPNFEQNFFSTTAKGVYKTAHDRIRLMKWLA